MAKFPEEECIPTVETTEENDQSVTDEINRCRDLYMKRQILKRQKAIDIKPLYYETMKKRDLVAKYPVYKTWISCPKPQRAEICNHVGRIIIDRDILTTDEHFSFLAQPKEDFGRKLKPPQLVFQRRYLPNCTTRVEKLAFPKTIRVQHNWRDFHNILSVRHNSNLRKTLQKPPLPSTTIDKALTYIHEERRLKSIMKHETARKYNKIKRKILKMEKKQMAKILYALYELRKDDLLNDGFVMDSYEEGNNLVRVIEKKISEFCDYDENNSTSHVKRMLKTIAINIAVWIEKFTANCGFNNARYQQEIEEDAKGEICKDLENSEFLLPVEDYISYQSVSTTDNFVDMEDEVCDDEYSEEEN